MHFAYATLPLRAIFHISCKSQHQLQSQSQQHSPSLAPSPFQSLSHPHSQSHFERQSMSEFGCMYLCLRLGYGVGFNKLAWGAPAAIVVVAVVVFLVVAFHFLLFALGIP